MVVIFCPHGVGKGTVAEALCRKHGYAHVSFGELLLNLQCSRRCCCPLNACNVMRDACAGDIKRDITSSNPALSRDFGALGPAVFKGYVRTSFLHCFL